MRELDIRAGAIPNTAKLHDELISALGAKYLNLSTSGKEIVVRLDDSTTIADDDIVETVVANHDPTPLPDALIEAWKTIQQQTASRPLAAMDFNQLKTWIQANVTDTKTQVALVNLGEEVLILRAQIALVARALAHLFEEV